MNDSKFKALMGDHGQEAILRHYSRLSKEERGDLLARVKGLDFGLAFSLFRRFADPCTLAVPARELGQAEIIRLPSTPREEDLRNKARSVGEGLLRDGKVAVLVVAGGQGSRLGFPGPKGMCPCTPVMRKPLFQVFAEQVRACSLRYGRPLPLLVMTSRENHEETLAFFASRDFFGLPAASVSFFSQALLPSLTPNGQLILKDRTGLVTNPDGHGGSLKALYRSRLLHELSDRGISELFYCQVDNPLVKIADPVFLGHHALAGADVSTKVVRRTNEEEKVGVYVSAGGRDTIVEYSEMGDEQMRARDGAGKILFWAGNTAIHVFRLPYVRRLSEAGFALPYHRAVRVVDALAADGRATRVTAWKFETFVFDAIPLAAKACCMEVLREEEFSPIKNMEGIDSPLTALRDMENLHRKWLRKAGCVTPPEARIEISPLYALDEEQLAEKFSAGHPPLAGDVYLGER